MTGARVDERVLWHDAECGAYVDDLEVWEELARAAGADVLELGCGTGRVALHLAGDGHRVWAVDVDPGMVAALVARAAEHGLEVEASAADCRRLALGRRFGLIVAPMQLIQLLGGPAGRRALLERARAHLDVGGLLAVAIVEGVPPAALGPGGDLLPDVREVAGVVYSSLPLGSALVDGGLEVRRLRQVVSMSGDLREEVHAEHLDLVDAGALEAEAIDCGLEPAGRLEIPAGSSHVGSSVVLLEEPR